MILYFDSAYIAKCYLHEPGANLVRNLSRNADGVASSALCIAELACVFHRHRREGVLSRERALAVRRQFLEDLQEGVWRILPVTETLLRRVETLTRAVPASCFVRAGDAIHLASAAGNGFEEIWSNDRHLLAAAPHFGLRGRSVA